jgi:RNA polymerase sigma-70 factor (ECF subfamily)
LLELRPNLDVETYPIEPSEDAVLDVTAGDAEDDPGVEPDSPPAHDLAFDEYVTPLYGPMIAYARKLTRDPTRAEDVVHDAMVRALRGWSRLRRPNPGYEAATVRLWIMQIVTNVFLSAWQQNIYRSNRIADNRDDVIAVTTGGRGEVVDFSYGKDERVEAGHLRPARVIASTASNIDQRLPLELIAALRALPVQNRRALELHARGRTVTQIAAIMNAKVGTILSRLHRARAQIQPLLEGLARENGLWPPRALRASAVKHAHGSPPPRGEERDAGRVESVVVGSCPERGELGAS